MNSVNKQKRKKKQTNHFSGRCVCATIEWRFVMGRQSYPWARYSNWMNRTEYKKKCNKWRKEELKQVFFFLTNRQNKKGRFYHFQIGTIFCVWLRLVVVSVHVLSAQVSASILKPMKITHKKQEAQTTNPIIKHFSPQIFLYFSEPGGKKNYGKFSKIAKFYV